MIFKNNLRMVVDTKIGNHFYEGVIDALRKNKLASKIFMVSGGGEAFYLSINLFSKRYYQSEEEIYKSVSNTVPETDPFYFVCLSENSSKTKITSPSYFVLNGKENNYKVKLLEASKKDKKDAIAINGNLYYNGKYTDVFPVTPLLNDFQPFIGLFIIKKENYELAENRLSVIRSKNIIMVQENNDYDEGYRVCEETINKFGLAQIKNGDFSRLYESLPKNNTIYCFNEMK